MSVENTAQTQNFTFMDLYNTGNRTGNVDVEALTTDEQKDEQGIIKSELVSVPTGSAVADLSAEAQMNKLLKRDATTGELYIDDFGMATEIYQNQTAMLSNLRDYDTNKGLSSSSGKQFFSNNNNDPQSFFAKNVGSVSTGAINLADIYSKPGGGGPMGAFVTGMMGAIFGGGFPLGTAASWMAYGFAQEKDKNNFIKELNGGVKNFLSTQKMVMGDDSEVSYNYGPQRKYTSSQYMNHILYNSNNPGYALKKYADYGSTPTKALANFMNDGVDNGVFSFDSILKMGSMRHEFKGGSNDYMKALAAEQALKDKGWTGKGRLWTDPDGNQYLDGNLFKTGVTTTSTEPAVTTQFKTKDSDPVQTTSGSDDNQSNNQPGNVVIGGGADASQSNFPTSSVSSAPASYTYTTSSATGAKDGFSYGLQMGGPVDMQTADNLEMVNEPGKDMSGVADDVSRQLDEGDFVINAPAVKQAGKSDIEKMINKAVSELQKKGVKLDFGKIAEDIDKAIATLVSNGEVIIPKVIAEQIGYDRLEKINNRGKDEVKEISEEREQIQQQPRPQGMMRMGVQMGGQINLDENKNQPIAVPRESFAGQSSVGRRLLSPMSPEAQDDEAELASRSQSFEGFLRPIKMQTGSVIGFTDEEFDNLIMRESSGNPKAKGDEDTGDTAVGLTQVRGLALQDVNKELGTNYTKDDLLNNEEISKLVGKTYLNQQLKRFGSKELALAAYNLGPTNVQNITNGSMLNYYKLPNTVKSYVSTVLDKVIPEVKPKPTR